MIKAKEKDPDMSTTSKLDATPAYRDYRLQTLYTLSRILEDNKHFTFQPENDKIFENVGKSESCEEVGDRGDASSPFERMFKVKLSVIS